MIKHQNMAVLPIAQKTCWLHSLGTISCKLVGYNFLLACLLVGYKLLVQFLACLLACWLQALGTIISCLLACLLGTVLWCFLDVYTWLSSLVLSDSWVLLLRQIPISFLGLTTQRDSLCCIVITVIILCTSLVCNFADYQMFSRTFFCDSSSFRCRFCGHSISFYVGLTIVTTTITHLGWQKLETEQEQEQGKHKSTLVLTSSNFSHSPFFLITKSEEILIFLSRGFCLWSLKKFSSSFKVFPPSLKKGSWFK